jgi:hypothetical protein
MQARVLMTQPVIDDIPVWFQRSRELGGRRSSDAIPWAANLQHIASIKCEPGSTAQQHFADPAAE